MKHILQLKNTMKAAGWSQEQLAAQLNVSFTTLNFWINGKSNPRKKALVKIEQLYASVAGSTEIDSQTTDASVQRANKLSLSANSIIKDKKLLELLTLHLTYNTNNIEGSTMTLSDVKDVLFDNRVLSSRTAIEQAEARNHKAALEWLLDKIAQEKTKFVVNEDLILNIHLRLMNGILSDAGKYRKNTVRIMGSRVPLANWASIPEQLDTLTAARGKTSESYDVVRSIAKFHADFEKVHPFSDGNGRTGRLFLLAQALQHNITPPIIQKERKIAYYKYLELAQVDGRYEHLESFIAESVIYADKLFTTQ